DRALDASVGVGVEGRHVIVHLEPEGADLREQILVGDPEFFRYLVDAHLCSARHSCALLRVALSTASRRRRPESDAVAPSMSRAGSVVAAASRGAALAGVPACGVAPWGSTRDGSGGESIMRAARTAATSRSVTD